MSKNKISPANVLDLDEVKAARTEAVGGGYEVRFGGESFHLPAEIPADVVDRLLDLQVVTDDLDPEAETMTTEQQKALHEALISLAVVLLGEEQWQAFSKHRPSLEDIQALVDGVLTLYGMKPGESGASAES